MYEKLMVIKRDIKILGWCRVGSFLPRGEEDWKGFKRKSTFQTSSSE